MNDFMFAAIFLQLAFIMLVLIVLGIRSWLLEQRIARLENPGWENPSWNRYVLPPDASVYRPYRHD